MFLNSEVALSAEKGSSGFEIVAVERQMAGATSTFQIHSIFPRMFDLQKRITDSIAICYSIWPQSLRSAICMRGTNMGVHLVALFFVHTAIYGQHPDSLSPIWGDFGLVSRIAALSATNNNNTLHFPLCLHCFDLVCTVFIFTYPSRSLGAMEKM